MEKEDIMYNEPIFLKPVFHEKIWGGTKLHDLYDYHIPSDKTGEAWVISAHPNGPSEIVNGPLKGKTLRQAWEEHPELFGKNETTDEFPLLVKIIDANDDLSVQVHPDDIYAREVEGERFGKTECWYMLDCEPGAEIVFGHHAQSAEEFKRMVETGEWDQLLKRIKVQKGDFFYVPSGTIHAIGKGIVILETQQSSDITYRVYDYDRMGDDGQPRDLHIKQAIDVTNYPNHNHHVEQTVEQTVEQIEDLQQTRLIQEKYFTVYHWQLSGTVTNPLNVDYLLCSVIKGSGAIIIDGKEFSIKKGDHFILPAMVRDVKLVGEIELIISHE